MLDLLGGTVTVESTVGEGATFRVWFPLQAEGKGVAEHPPGLESESVNTFL
jgi:light-regulated signal transduction histidine kinase (bacteriophytochrome)